MVEKIDQGCEKMKYTILGFNQAKLIELGLDIDDALILRYFVDFKDSGQMTKELFDSEMFYWINYDSIKRELPILDISKDRVYRKLKKLVDAGILLHKTKKDGGTFSFYALGDRYVELISSKENTTEGTVKLPEGMAKTPEGYGENNGEGTVKTPERYGKNTRTKDSSIIYQSIKDSSTKDIYIQVINYLNLKAHTNYKHSSRKTQDLIRARMNEQFALEHFKKVIDIKCTEWMGTEWEKFLRPETLFGPKFEGYLNQKNCPKVSKTEKGQTFSHYEQREDALESYKKVQELQQSELGETEINKDLLANIGKKVKGGELN